MWRRLFRRTVSALLVLILWAAPALAQQAGNAEEKTAPAPALQHTVAILCTLLVLFIVCKPSRKS